jgi:predicted dehydrogenase
VKNSLGLAVIGLGMAGERHARALLDGSVRGARLAAVCDIAPARLAPFPVYRTEDPAALLAQPEVDAVVIATPHPSHADLARLALQRGCAVLVEKPLALHKTECERLLAFHAALPAPRPVFGVVHDYRADTRFTFLNEILTSGELGRVERVVWQVTDWFRTDAYYRNSDWRGRFSTEGGGMLVNQAPHVLDTVGWLFGMPHRVHGVCRFGRFHEIDVEDDVTALLEYASGMTVHLILGTGEAPGTNRLEVSADRGRVVIEGGSALVHRNREAASRHRRRDLTGRPLGDVERLQFPPRAKTGLLLLDNFVQAITGQQGLLAPAAQAARAVELANAILWSSLEERPVQLPLEGEAFAELYARLRQRGSLLNEDPQASAGACR